MARRLFDCYHAPEEEVQGVRDALDSAGVDWYETTKGRWWVGSASLWVRDESRYRDARQVIDEFQLNWRSTQSRRTIDVPENQTIRWRRVPVFVAVVIVILYLSLFGFRM